MPSADSATTRWQRVHEKLVWLDFAASNRGRKGVRCLLSYVSGSCLVSHLSASGDFRTSGIRRHIWRPLVILHFLEWERVVDDIDWCYGFLEIIDGFSDLTHHCSGVATSRGRLRPTKAEPATRFRKVTVRTLNRASLKPSLRAQVIAHLSPDLDLMLGRGTDLTKNFGKIVELEE